MIDYDQHENFFKQIYVSLHPEEQYTGRVMSNYALPMYYYYSFINSWDILNCGPLEFFDTFRTTVDDLIEESVTSVWLFYNFPVEDIFKKAAIFIINNCHKDINFFDLYLLFYISLQAKDFKDPLKDLSLSLLHDMFIPVVETNLEKWVKEK
jgi:hypothetical protein